ncbi:putative fluoride ion transporter CrcB 2 [Kaistia sp. 32K]|uniref:CrcB family protein n=1 Tax=Kaistia sp. 32K TaxID=2795690 RepID=UPI00191636C0|nr:CrcB family protein [Kaistia sp. 32K]BCP55709.1 putative fluoride ion transporter CrcB 2 [Kaistia sp. 32K]
MINAIVLVFVGGALGAMVREFLMLGVPDLSDGFPTSILAANVVAAFLLGLVTGLHNRKSVSDDVNTLVATGIMGGLSTFSSFVYGSYVLMSETTSGAVVAVLYLVVSLVAGYAAVEAGLKLGGPRRSEEVRPPGRAGGQ